MLQYLKKASLQSLFWLFSLSLCLPIVAIFYQSIAETGALFEHLITSVLPTYALNTFALVLGICVLSLCFALPPAWCLTMYQVPTGRYLQWLLVLPLAMPAYIIGYIYTDWFDVAGPIQLALRSITGWQVQDYSFFEMRSLSGAILVLSLVLFPYIYLLARSAFLSQNTRLLQSASILKASSSQSFFKIALPLARPAIMVGLSLVAMETLADFGTVKYFALNTLTTGVYDTWLGYSNLGAAAQIASFMLLVIFLLIGFETYGRRKQKVFQESSPQAPLKKPLHGWKKYFILTWCYSLVFAGFILPLGQLLSYAWRYFSQSLNNEFFIYTQNSLMVSTLAASVALIFALSASFYQRYYQYHDFHHSSVGLFKLNRWAKAPSLMGALGYALPGTILAIGSMTVLLGLDHALNNGLKILGFSPVGLVFSGSIVALIFAFVVRFSAVAIGSVQSGLGRLSPNLDYAARSMGESWFGVVKKVHLPLLMRASLTAFLLVFIESMKELNASILLRPFNFETLATYVYNYTSDEMLEHASLAAILLVLVGTLPLIFIHRSIDKGSL